MGIDGYRLSTNLPPKWQSTGPGGNSLNIPPREQQRSEIEEFAHRPTTAERLMGLNEPSDHSPDPEGFLGISAPTAVRPTDPQLDSEGYLNATVPTIRPSDSEVDENDSHAGLEAHVDGLKRERTELQEELETMLDRNDMSPHNVGGPSRAATVTNLHLRIDELDMDIARFNDGYRPLFLNSSNDESRDIHANAAGIDRELLDAIIKHEGGNFHSPFGGGWRLVQEFGNDTTEFFFGEYEDGSVGYAQIQPPNAVAIARDTFGLDLSEEEARELLTSNDEFSNAIASEFLAQRAELIDPQSRTNQTVFTSHAMSEDLITIFNDAGWDFAKVEDLIGTEIELETRSYSMTQERFDNVYLRYTEAWPAAINVEAPVVNKPDTSGHIPAPTQGPNSDWNGTSVFDDNQNVNNAGVPVSR